MIGEDFILPDQDFVLNEVSEFNTFLEKNFSSSPSPKRVIPNPPSFVDNPTDNHHVVTLSEESGRSNENLSSNSSSTGCGSIEMFLNSLDGDMYKDLLEKKEKSIDELKNQNQFSILYSYSRIRIGLGVTNSQIRKTQQKVDKLKKDLAKAKKKSVVLSRRALFHENQIHSKSKNRLFRHDEILLSSPRNFFSKNLKNKNRRISLQTSYPRFRDEFLESPKKRKKKRPKNGSDRKGRRKTTNQIFQQTSDCHPHPHRILRSSMDHAKKSINWEEELRKLRGEEVHQQCLKNMEERKKIEQIKNDIESLRRKERFLSEKNDIVRTEYESEKENLVSKLDMIGKDLQNCDMKILELEKARELNSFLSLEKEVFEHIV